MKLEAKKIEKSYKSRKVVNGIDLELKQGEIVGLLGPNGAGKTTCFYMIVGLIKCDNGLISINEIDISNEPMYKRAKQGIGYLAQEASVFRKLTVEENIKAVLELTDKSKSEQENDLENLINEFSLEKVRKNRGDLLSGGERRRTEIARALATEPKFLLLDEPFAGVDPIAVEEIQKIIAHLKAKNIGVLITDHNVQETLAITDRTYLMFEGKILKSGKPEELAQDEIVRKISLALLGEIEISSLERANRKPTENLTSYELLLRGKVLHHKFKREACLEAIDSFNQAIKADSNNGQAYAWKACAIGQGMGRGYLEGDMQEWWDNSMQCIEKAQQLNDNDFEVHRMLAEVALSTHDFKAGERHARTSFKMVPNDPRVLSVYGEILCRTGSTEKGIELLESALELDPIPMGKTNTDHRTGAVLFGYFMDRNSKMCIELIKNLQDIDFKSWLVTAKICDDEEIEYTSEVWFTENKDHFKEMDWEMEIDRFHLNNEGLQKSLVGFVESLFN